MTPRYPVYQRQLSPGERSNLARRQAIHESEKHRTGQVKLKGKKQPFSLRQWCVD